MERNDYLKMLVEEIHSTTMATIGADGHPQTCVIDMMLWDEKGVYFLTAKGKAFYAQLMEQGYVAISATKDKKAVSLRGRIQNIHSEKLDEIFEKNPYMQKIYPGDTRSALEVFRLYEAEGEYFDISDPSHIVRDSIVIGAAKPSAAGYEVEKECIGCKLCFAVCPQKCIDITRIPVVIDQHQCLHCGRCAETCPKGAIRKRGNKMNQSERRNFLIQSLLEESREYRGMQIPSDSTGQKQLLRGLMNVRMAKKSSAEFLKVQNAYLQEETAQKGVTDVEVLTPVQPGIYLWQGDITALRCDAIVNAANSGMTGCYVPNHRCIDNCIHTFAGVQLRMYCEKMMEMQGHAEPTGQAKITPAFNLPCHYILHTVGPIVGGHLTETHCRQLAECYRSCLTLAAKYELKSVAFCCISTGEFHFPNEKAAEIAVAVVKEFLEQENTSVKKVIFNVFKDRDREIYERLLREK